MDLINFIGKMLIMTDLMLLILGSCIIWLIYQTNKTILQQRNKATKPQESVKPERKHEPVAKAKFTNALNPYDQYKDKQSNLYAPRKPKGGVELKREDKE